MEITPADREQVTSDYLINLLAERLVFAMDAVDTNLYPDDDANRMQNIVDRSASATLALNFLPQLVHGMDVDVNFKSPRKFTPSDAMAVFEAFQIELVHGWVLDPDITEYWDVIVGQCGGSYNRVVDLIAHGDWAGSGTVVDSSLNETVTQFEAQSSNANAKHHALVHSGI